MTPDERLDEIEARADAAMPGPWAATRTLLRSGCVGIAVHQRAGGTFVMVDRDREVRVEDAEFMAAAREDVPWLIRELRDAREGKPFRLCEQCLSDLEAPMCEDCYHRSGSLAAANSARDAAIDQLADANREIVALVKHVNDLCDVRDEAITVKAELRDARAEIERLRESTTELAHAKAKIDNLLRDNHDLCRTIADLRSDLRAANTTVDETFREAEAELAAERAKVERVDALFASGPDTSCRTVWQDGIECVSVPLADLRAALAGDEQGE